MVGVFDIYKSTGVIDGFDGEDINISGEKDWPEELIIQNCPNLKSVDCSDLIGIKKLEILDIRDCPNLEYLNASNNDIKSINLKIGNDKLETINLNDNKLTTFNTSGLSNLKDLDVGCNKLTSLDLPDCGGLEKLSANNNSLRKLSLNGLTNLIICYVPYNRLKEINLESCENLSLLNVSDSLLRNLYLTDTKKLKFLNFSRSKGLKKIEVKHLDELRKLNCESCSLNKLDCNGLEKLEELYCFANRSYTSLPNGDCFFRSGLNELNINGCESLKILDCAENSFRRLLLDNHQKLQQVSVKNNCLEGLLINLCPSLGFLEFSRQYNINFDKVFNGKDNTNYTTQSVSFLISKNSCASLEKVTFAERTKIFLIQGTEPVPFDWEEDFKYFPKLTDFGAGNIADDPAFEEWLDKQRQEEWERDNLNQPDESYQSEENNNNTIPNCNWRIPEEKEKFDELNISHRHLKGKLIIEDWPNLKLLDVGDNRLQALVIINCPKLRKLIYAHNAMPNEAEISGCDIREIDNYRYDEFVGKEDEPISEEERAYIEEQERKEQQQEDEGYESEEEIRESKINYEINLEYLESLTYEELCSLDPESVPRNLAHDVISLLTKKFKEQIKQQEQEEKKTEEDLQKIAGLITEAQQFLKEGNLPELARVLEGIEKYCDTSAYADNKQVITNLKQELHTKTTQHQKSLETNEDNRLNLIFGTLLGIIGLLLALLIIKLNKDIKKLFSVIFLQQKKRQN